MSDCVFAIVGDGFVLMAADTSANQSIIRMKTGEDKILEATSHMLLGATGDGGDRVQFTEMVQANMQLYKFRNGISLSTHAAANYVRGELATALRKGPYNCNLLVAGYDNDAPSLYYVDYLSCLHKMNCSGHGYGAIFCYSLFDKHWKPNMTEVEVKELAKLCLAEIKARLVVAPPEFRFKVVDKDGIRTVEL
mmetsp:Transcript_38741/g.65212  ORF Transcript_38741/g.65212 Transcript_38741/m.65212 type:complete len:193 (+) Transcript_38741:246-824(+)|eukprot:CAMPEP_0198197800 /NCGR_PEP_ID=MMETSP1445-20131203/1358_1 /TAXON_ID=36898 /ORGANISM="Pyramimonas sp., Strain CCMP2087" /LENGTH=192 /DNA_ID=CAMNT_0043867189 /DNA_START=246 /DNA_END=824 /DNA_ORIENTATION=+